MHRTAALFVRLLIVSLAAAALFPAVPVAAHCPPEDSGRLLGIVSTCPLNEDLETAVDALNEASDGAQVYVLVKDFAFHPPVVDVRSGGTIIFVYADADDAQEHDPMSSGSTGDAVTDVSFPTPQAPGACFDQTFDQEGVMNGVGDTYPLSLRWDGSRVQKSHGVQSDTAVGELTGASPWFTCPASSASVDGAGSAIVPYHCALHGGATTSLKIMRGALRIQEG